MHQVWVRRFVPLLPHGQLFNFVKKVLSNPTYFQECLKLQTSIIALLNKISTVVKSVVLKGCSKIA